MRGLLDELDQISIYADPFHEEYLCDLNLAEVDFVAGHFIFYGDPVKVLRRYGQREIQSPFKISNLSKVNENKKRGDLRYELRARDEEGDVFSYNFAFFAKIEGRKTLIGNAFLYEFKTVRNMSDSDRLLTMDCVTSAGEFVGPSIFNNYDIRPELESFLDELTDSILLLEYLEVKEPFRKMGYGSMILTFLQKYFRNHNAAFCLLAHSQLPGDSEANTEKLMQWYRSFGFSRINCSTHMVLTDFTVASAKLEKAKLNDLRATAAQSTNKYIVIPELFWQINQSSSVVDEFKEFVAMTTPNLVKTLESQN